MKQDEMLEMLENVGRWKVEERGREGERGEREK